ncbi:MAG: phosphatidylglycerophosphatase A [Syntrophorhabdaceae bacterium]|nr:phosphatidylglycerophosphatase A [Syntrophorhabdaceae bacterium]
MNRCYLFFVTCGFIGYLPFMPGTYASAMGCIILYLLPVDSLMIQILILICLLALSVICLNRMRLERNDPSYVVIDEMAGMFMTMVGHRATILNLVAGFILFRLFDIVKPYPIRYVERYKKGYGIVADDIVAGAFANICLYIFLFFKGLVL